VRLATDASLGALAVGAAQPINLSFRPATGEVAEGIYTFYLRVAGASLANLDVPLYAVVTGSGKGRAVFQVEDIYTGTLDKETALVRLFEAGWFLDGDTWDRLVPSDHYLTGHLWPRYDRAATRARQGDEQAAVQQKRLLDTIRPAVFDDVEGVSPRQGWVPLDMVEGWFGEVLNARYGEVKLARKDGLVVPEGVSYDDIDDTRALAPEARWCIGWMNHDKTVFKPK
jgi:hypothetical protein